MCRGVLIGNVRPPVVEQDVGRCLSKHRNLSRKILPLVLTGMIVIAASQVLMLGSAGISPKAFSVPH